MTAREIIKSQCYHCIFSYTWKLQDGRWDCECSKNYTQLSYADCPDFKAFPKNRLLPENNINEVKPFNGKTP